MDVASDPTLRAYLKAARAWGVSPSIFMGAKHVTTHEYNSHGQMVKSVTTPEWTAEDRDLAMQLSLYEAQLCPEGHYIPESAAADAEEDFESVVEGLCHACVAEHQAAKRWEDHKHPYALLVSTHRKP
jgi:hypothetical protein